MNNQFSKATFIVNARFLTQETTGVQRFAIEVARQLKLLSPSIIFVTPGDINQKQVADELEAIVVGSRKGVLWEQYDLPKYLKQNSNPFLLNLGNVAPLFYKNQAVVLHDVAFIVNPAWFSKSFVAFYKFLIPRILKRSKLVFTVSEFSKEEITKYFRVDPAKIEVVYNSLSNIPNPEVTLRVENDYILAVGSIDERKNLNTLIKAFKLVKTPGLKLIIAGDKNAIFNSKNNAEFKSTDNIYFTGRVTDLRLAELYKGATVFIYPSLYEGFGIPPLEAMSYNCPTIVSDIPSLREVCADASLYLNPMEAQDIALKIDLLIADDQLKAKLIANGKKNLTRFSWKKSAEEILRSINLKS